MCACSKGISPKTTRHKGRKLEAVNVSDACKHWCDKNVEENVDVEGCLRQPKDWIDLRPKVGCKGGNL